MKKITSPQSFPSKPNRHSSGSERMRGRTPSIITKCRQLLAATLFAGTFAKATPSFAQENEATFAPKTITPRLSGEVNLHLAPLTLVGSAEGRFPYDRSEAAFDHTHAEVRAGLLLGNQHLALGAETLFDLDQAVMPFVIGPLARINLGHDVAVSGDVFFTSDSKDPQKGVRVREWEADISRDGDVSLGGGVAYEAHPGENPVWCLKAHGGPRIGEKGPIVEVNAAVCTENGKIVDDMRWGVNVKIEVGE